LRIRSDILAPTALYAGRDRRGERAIILYLATIADFCAEEGEDFASEVRLTYLHELGHHLAGRGRSRGEGIGVSSTFATLIFGIKKPVVGPSTSSF